MCTIWLLERHFPSEQGSATKTQRIILKSSVSCHKVGRARSNEINCPSTYVSRRHCTILNKGNELYIIDGGSSNGTFINRCQILAHREIPLRPGDIIGFGTPDVQDTNCYVYTLRKQFDEINNEDSVIVISDTEELEDGSSYITSAPRQETNEGLDSCKRDTIINTIEKQPSRKRGSDLPINIPCKVSKKSYEESVATDKVLKEGISFMCGVINEEPCTSSKTDENLFAPLSVPKLCETERDYLGITTLPRENISHNGNIIIQSSNNPIKSKILEEDVQNHPREESHCRLAYRPKSLETDQHPPLRINNNEQLMDNVIMETKELPNLLRQARNICSINSVTASGFSEKSVDKTNVRGTLSSESEEVKANIEDNTKNHLESISNYVAQQNSGSSVEYSQLPEDQDKNLETLHSRTAIDTLNPSTSNVPPTETNVHNEKLCPVTKTVNIPVSVNFTSLDKNESINQSKDCSEEKVTLNTKIKTERPERSEENLCKKDETFSKFKGFNVGTTMNAVVKCEKAENSENVDQNVNVIPKSEKCNENTVSENIIIKSEKPENSHEDMLLKAHTVPKLKELIVKVERLSEFETKQRNTSGVSNDNDCTETNDSILNYTLDDDIVIISDDEELFPTSQLFNEDMITIKQEIMDSNSSPRAVDNSPHSVGEVMDCDIGGLQIPVDEESDDNDDDDNWLRRLSQTYTDFKDDPELMVEHPQESESELDSNKNKEKIHIDHGLELDQEHNQEPDHGLDHRLHHELAEDLDYDLVDEHAHVLDNAVDRERAGGNIFDEVRKQTYISTEKFSCSEGKFESATENVQNLTESHTNLQPMSEEATHRQEKNKSSGVFSKTPILIDAPPMIRRRHHDKLQPKKPKIKDLPEMSRKFYSPVTQERQKMKQKKISKRATNSSESIISSNEKKKISEVRKMRLKEIAETKRKDEGTKEVKRSATLRVKVTEKNRGAFLAENLSMTCRKSTKDKPCSKQNNLKDNMANSSSVDNKASTPSVSSRRVNVLDDELKNQFAHSLTDNLSVNKQCERSTSSKKEPGNRSISALPRIPRLSRMASKENSSCDHISPLQESSIRTDSGNSSNAESTSSGQVFLPEGNNKDSNMKQDSPTVGRSCLKPVGNILTRLNQKKRVSFNLNQTQVRTFVIPMGSVLKPVGLIKDAPLPKFPVSSSMPEGAQNETFLNEIISLICQWNPKWMQEQKRNNVPPPITSMKLFPMLSYFKSYEDYKKVLLPLMLLEVWHAICKDTEDLINTSRSATRIFMLEEVNSQANGLMSILCSNTLSHKELSQNQYPKAGDLLLAEIQVHSASNISDMAPSQDFRGGRYFANAFAYVHNVTVERSCRNSFNKTFKTGFQTQQSSQEVKLNLRLLVKGRNYKTGTNMRLKVISYLRAELRQFQGLNALTTSPLRQQILEPKLSDYRIPSVENGQLWSKEHLNEKQKECILKCEKVCTGEEPKLCLIQGPPGTGKSTVIKNMVMQILYGKNEYRRYWRKANHRCPRILLCAPSNAAVDELVDRLLIIRQSMPKEERFKMVRVGKTMRPTVSAISLDELAKKEVRKLTEVTANDPESLNIEFRCLDAKEKSYQMAYEATGTTEVSKQALLAKIAAVKAKRKVLEQKCQTNTNRSQQQQLADERRAQLNILKGADVIATTINSCFSNQMESIFGINAKDRIQLTCCIVDEATQCSEAESLIPLLLGIKCMVLVGDPEQLPATIMSHEAKQLGLGQSMFSRLRGCFESQEESPVLMLKVQYRMHPEICLWPNQYFYMNQLENSPGLAEERRSILVPYTILSLHHSQDRSGQMKNTGEASFVVKLARMILNITSRKMSVGIIAPYNKQRQELISQMEECSTIDSKLIDIQTIDSSQGSERDVIIISCTRTDGIGFLTNTERLNVAVTRARYSLIICGNFLSLKNDAMWSSLLSNAVDRYCFKTVLPSMKDSSILNLITIKTPW